MGGKVEGLTRTKGRLGFGPCDPRARIHRAAEDCSLRMLRVRRDARWRLRVGAGSATQVALLRTLSLTLTHGPGPGRLGRPGLSRLPTSAHSPHSEPLVTGQWTLTELACPVWDRMLCILPTR